ncbi:SCO2322 family protein [Streptomyces griseoviridis]
MIRRVAAVLGAALLTALLAWSPAQAAGYRYWSFWERTGDRWTYATQGPSTTRPDDGSVQGFRFSVSADSADAARPRGTAVFTAICAGVPERDGAKRVALVLDFGTAADAPSGESPPARRTACARVPSDATTAEALAAVAKPLRYGSDALLCAIAGYPERGCGEQVSTTTGGRPAPGPAAPGADDDGAGPSVGLLAGGGAVVLLGAAAVVRARRRGRE